MNSVELSVEHDTVNPKPNMIAKKQGQDKGTIRKRCQPLRMDAKTIMRLQPGKSQSATRYNKPQ